VAVGAAVVVVGFKVVDVGAVVNGAVVVGDGAAQALRNKVTDSTNANRIDRHNCNRFILYSSYVFSYVNGGSYI
jgi:hypothetical protein